MNSNTINAIAILLSLFTEEEKQGLKITLGDRELSLEDQFLGRWYNARPRFIGKVFLAKAAHIVSGNRLLFLRAIEFNSPEFQAKLREILRDPNSYVKLKETKTDNSTTQKGLTLGQAYRRDLSRGLTKNRSGLTESGQEYVDLERLWGQEDAASVASGMARPSIAASVNVDPDKRGVEGLTIGAAKAQEGQVMDWPRPAQMDESKEDMPLQSITLSQGRNQTINESQADNLNAKDEISVLDGKVVTKDMVTIEALQLMTATKIKDPRETAFQKLDVLFSQCQ